MSIAEILEELPKLTEEEREQVWRKLNELADDRATYVASPELLAAIDEARRDSRPSLSLEEVRQRYME